MVVDPAQPRCRPLDAYPVPRKSSNRILKDPTRIIPSAPDKPASPAISLQKICTSIDAGGIRWLAVPYAGSICSQDSQKQVRVDVGPGEGPGLVHSERFPIGGIMPNTDRYSPSSSSRISSNDDFQFHVMTQSRSLN